MEEEVTGSQLRGGVLVGHQSVPLPSPSSPGKLLPPPPLEQPQSAVLIKQLHSQQERHQGRLRPAFCFRSPHIMGQEGPRQPHANQQEEAEEDQGRLHSWRDRESRGTLGKWLRIEPLYKTPSPGGSRSEAQELARS